MFKGQFSMSSDLEIFHRRLASLDSNKLSGLSRCRKLFLLLQDFSFWLFLYGKLNYRVVDEMTMKSVTKKSMLKNWLKFVSTRGVLSDRLLVTQLIFKFWYYYFFSVGKTVGSEIELGLKKDNLIELLPGDAWLVFSFSGLRFIDWGESFSFDSKGLASLDSDQFDSFMMNNCLDSYYEMCCFCSSSECLEVVLWNSESSCYSLGSRNSFFSHFLIGLGSNSLKNNFRLVFANKKFNFLFPLKEVFFYFSFCLSVSDLSPLKISSTNVLCSVEKVAYYNLYFAGQKTWFTSPEN